MIGKALLVVTLFGVCFAFKFEKCPSNESVIDVQYYLNISPDPLIIPGKADATIKLAIKEELSNTVRVEVKIKRITLMSNKTFEVPVPCLKNFGSCTYQLCDILESIAPIIKPFWPANIPYSCPIKPFSKEVNIPEIKILYKFKAANYIFEVNGYDGDRHLTCYKITTGLQAIQS